MRAVRLTVRRLAAYLVDVLVAAVAYALMLAYLVVALLNGGSRSVGDLVAGTQALPVAAETAG